MDSTPLAADTVVVNQNNEVDGMQDQFLNGMEETRAGYKTTEFWLTVASSLLIALDGIPVPEKYEGAIIALVATGYTLSRGLAKKGVPHVPSASS